SEGANRYGDLTTGDAPGIRSMQNFISRTRGKPNRSSGNTLGKSVGKCKSIGQRTAKQKVKVLLNRKSRCKIFMESHKSKIWRKRSIKEDAKESVETTI
ncbi:hypothetical protein Tco_0208164, partial [Tanacetum coccineum]